MRLQSTRTILVQVHRERAWVRLMTGRKEKEGVIWALKNSECIFDTSSSRKTRVFTCKEIRNYFRILRNPVTIPELVCCDWEDSHFSIDHGKGLCNYNSLTDSSWSSFSYLITSVAKYGKSFSTTDRVVNHYNY